MRKAISFFRGLSLRISTVHPLTYVVVYILAIPVFAEGYCLIPSGFYAPYAHLEYSGKSDEYRAGVMIQTAISRRLHTHQATNEASLPVRDFYVQRLRSVDNTAIEFDLLTMLWNEQKKGLVQISIPIVVRSQSRIVIDASSPGERPKNFVLVMPRYNEIPASLLPLVKAATTQLFAPGYDFLGKGMILLELTNEEDEQLARLFDGLGGDALAISGTYGRMLYFSVTVITTVGFGDVVPMSPLARSVVGIEAVLGIVIAGLFLNAVAYRASTRRS